MLELYKNIKMYRKERQMSQEHLAKLVGYSDRSSIAKIENGEVDLPQSKIALFASALSVSPAALMGNTGLEHLAEPPQLSDQAMQVAIAYDKADDRVKTGVEVALGLDFIKKDAALPSSGSALSGNPHAFIA